MIGVKVGVIIIDMFVCVMVGDDENVIEVMMYFVENWVGAI